MIKKIVFAVMIILISVLSKKIVSAEEVTLSGAEYLYNIMYDKFDGVNHKRNYVRVIRENGNGDIVYCLEPFSSLIDGSKYTVYNDLKDFFDISSEDYEKIKLYAYYGYGYKDHTDLSWVNVTQMLIWRTLYKDSSFIWVNSLSDNAAEIKPLKREVNELNNLVSLHLMQPSISHEMNLQANIKYDLIDIRNVLQTYEVESSDGLDVSIVADKLVVDVKEAGTYNIRLKKKVDNLGYTFKYFYSNESQAAFKRGDINPSYYDIKLNVKSGKIKINKKDSITLSSIPSGDASLTGSIFTVYNKNMEEVGKIEIDSNSSGYIDNLPFGKYIIKEEKAGRGYNLNNESIEVNLSFDNNEVSLDVLNDVIKREVKIIKRYGSKSDFDKNQMKPEEGISFEIFNEENELVDTVVTDINGEASIILPFGIYEIKQVNTTNNYTFVDNKKIIIDKQSNISLDLVLDDFEIEVPNASIFYDSFRSFCFGVIDDYLS